MSCHIIPLGGVRPVLFHHHGVASVARGQLLFRHGHAAQAGVGRQVGGRHAEDCGDEVDQAPPGDQGARRAAVVTGGRGVGEGRY